MSCNEMFEKLGFECKKVKLKNSEEATYINTPLTLASGDTVGFMVIKNADGGYTVTDNGDTIFELIGCGFDLSNRKRIQPINTLAQKHGLTLLQSGEIFKIVDESALDRATQCWIEFISEIINWQKDKLATGDQAMVFAEEVEISLRSWKPGVELMYRPSIKIDKELSYIFDFKLGNTFIDAIKPSSRTTGARARKILDVNRSLDSIDILIVIDDRLDKERAKHETNILSSIAKTINFSRLEESAIAH